MGNKKDKRHIKGERGEKFREKIKNFKGEQIIGVAIEISKSFHKVMVFDFEGQIIKAPFEIDVFADGYEKLKVEVSKAVQTYQVRKVFWTMEPSGPYYQNLARHLVKDGEEMIFMNPSAVASNREQRLLKGLKSDDIDLGSIADLLIRGEGYDYNLEEGFYLKLKERTWWREKKLKIQTMLKNQIRSRLEKIFPGLTSEYNDNQPLFSDLWTSNIARGLMKIKLTPKQILHDSDEELRKQFNKVGHPIDCVDKIKNYIARMLLPEDEVIRIELELLAKDVKLLETLEVQMKRNEQKMTGLLKKTSGGYLIGKIKGVSEIMIASFIGAVGDITKFDWAGQIFRKAGLDPKSKQTGGHEVKGLPIRRMGSKLLRCILYKMSDTVIKYNPYFGLYYEYLVQKRNKFWRKAQIAVANKLVRVMFAIVRDKAEFAPPTAKIDYLVMLFSKAKEERKQRRQLRDKKKGKDLADSRIFGPGTPSLTKPISPLANIVAQ